jgi:hypothetical protein
MIYSCRSLFHLIQKAYAETWVYQLWEQKALYDIKNLPLEIDLSNTKVSNWCVYMGPFFCFMVQRFSQQWGVCFNNAIIAFSMWTNIRGYKYSEKLMSHAWRLLMPVYSTFFTLKDSSAHQRYIWVPSTSVTLLEVVKMNCARARIGNLCNIFSEKKLITEHTCDYCRLEFTKILWHFHGQVQSKSAVPFASFMSTNLSVYSSCWISNWTTPSITRRQQLAINHRVFFSWGQQKPHVNSPLFTLVY